MSKKSDLKILKFPSNIAQLERQVEAILFAAEEPLDIESIQEKIKTKTDISKILSSLEKNRILISKNLESDYIIDNYINWYGAYKKKRHEIPNNFKIYKEIFVSGKRIISIYKRI